VLKSYRQVNYFKLIAIVFLEFLFYESDAQISHKNFPFTCTIIDDSSYKPVPFCRIYNETNRIYYKANENGFCRLKVTTGDTLVFESMGYLSRLYFVRKSDTIPLKIPMKVYVYEIEKISMDLPKNYDEVKQTILDIDPKKNIFMPEVPQYNPYIRPELLDTNVIYDPGFRVFHPVSGFYYKHSKIEISKRKVRDLQEQELKQNSVDAKYSREMVTELTGFEGVDLLNFLGYCNFSFNYLYDSSPLEIVEAIHRKHAEFLICCYEKEVSTPNP